MGRHVEASAGAGEGEVVAMAAAVAVAAGDLVSGSLGARHLGRTPERLKQSPKSPATNRSPRRVVWLRQRTGPGPCFESSGTLIGSQRLVARLGDKAAV